MTTNPNASDDGVFIRITDSVREDFITSFLHRTGDQEDVVRKKDLRAAYAQWLTEKHGRYSAQIDNREAGKLYSLMDVILGPFDESVESNGYRVFVGLVLFLPVGNTFSRILEPGVEIPQHLPWEPTGKRLGSGGQGHVYLVTNKETDDDTQYALKVLKSPSTPQSRQRFRREIETIQKLDHNLIIRVCDYSKKDNDFLYYVMEYHHGAQPLDSIIASSSTNPFHGNVLLSLELFEQIITAIDACQKNDPKITHRDINPENILLLKDGSIRLIDFGICHFENGETITLTDENVGRRNYTAPECEVSGTPVAGVHSDIYSASKTLWSVITSRRAFSREESVFKADSMQARFPDKTETWHLGRIFEKTIRKDPANRFTKTEDVLGLLAEVRYKIERGFPPFELAHTRCASCGGKGFVDLPDAETVFGPLECRNFNAVQCQQCGFVALRNHFVLRERLRAIENLQ